MDDFMNMELEEDKKRKRGPLIAIAAVFLILLLILMIVPQYGVKIDPRPERIPSFEEVFVFEKNLSTEVRTLQSREDFLDFVVPENPVVKTTANRIVSISCLGEKVCHAKAIYYFVRDNFEYISDPVNFEYVEMPQDFMISGGGDCESGTLLMANLMEAVGINSELVFIPGHAYLRIWVPEALNKYKNKGWIYLDWTCKNCDFGEIPYQNQDLQKTFLDVN